MRHRPVLLTVVIAVATGVFSSGAVADEQTPVPSGERSVSIAMSQGDSFAVSIAEGEAALAQRRFLSSLTAFRRANALRGRASPEAWLGMSRASYGQQVYPEALNSADQAREYVVRGSKLEGAVRHQRALALVGLVSVADDPRAREAELEFAAAAKLDAASPGPSYERGLALLNTYRDSDGVRELTLYLSGSGDVAKIEISRRLIADPRESRVPFAAPDFSLTAWNGEVFSRASLANKVVLLDFWGSWCQPCQANTPELVALHQKYASQVVTIGVAVWEGAPALWRAWIENHQMDWPQYMDGD